jgi:hypothetical protein
VNFPEDFFFKAAYSYQAAQQKQVNICSKRTREINTKITNIFAISYIQIHIYFNKEIIYKKNLEKVPI